MTCQELVEFLADYFGGQLAPETRALFDEHLAECPDCVAYLDTYRQTIQLCKQSVVDPNEVPAMPEELVRAIVESAKEVASASGKWRVEDRER
jgi:predicted anti-sigma-YlaC factor YlaD